MDTSDRFTDSSTKPPTNNISHIITIVKAAFPYLDSQSQQSMDLFLKTGELLETFHSLNQEGSVTALSIRKESIDLEALLTAIRDVCYKREQEFIDIILNFYKAKNLFSTYSTLASAMSSQGNNTDNANNLGSMFGMDSNSNMMDMLQAFLTPEQKSTFENINMMFNATQ